MRIYNFELHLIIDMFNIKAKHEREARKKIKENIIKYLRQTKIPLGKNEVKLISVENGDTLM